MSWIPILSLKPQFKCGNIDTLLNENVVFETPFSYKNYIVVLTPQFSTSGYYVGELTGRGFKIFGDQGLYSWLALPIT
jgi:hypothetical protein